MQRLCFTALCALWLTINLPAQSPAPATTSPSGQTAAPASGPTMDQTITFINEAFQKMGDFQYDAGDEKSPGKEVVCGHKSNSIEVHAQSIALRDSSTMMFTSNRTKTISEKQCSRDKHGNAKIDPVTHDYVTNTSVVKVELPITEELHLDALDPRTISVESNKVPRLRLHSTGVDTNVELGYDSTKTIPETYSLSIKRASSQTKGVIETIKVGTF